MTTSRSLLSAAACLLFAASGLAAQQPAQQPPQQPAQQPAQAPAPQLLQPASAQVPQITLAEALRLAAQNAPAMVQARQNLRIAHAQELQTFGAFLPTVNSSVNGSQSGAQRIDATTGKPVNTGSLINTSVGLSASLDLFTGFRRGANRRAAQATTTQRQAAQLQQEYATALAAKQAFFTALANAELVTVAESQLRRSGEQLKLTTEKLRLGATTRADSLSAMVDYGNSQLQLIQAQANLQFAQVNLGRTIGIDGAVAPVADSALEVRLGALDTVALRNEATANAPSVRQAEASLAASRASLGASRSQYLPTISATASQSWARAEQTLFSGIPFTSSWSVRVGLSYPIFNGFQRETNIATADANVITAQANLRDARLALDASLTQAVSGMYSASQQIDIARVSVAAAEENIRMQRERYRLGTSTIVDLLTTQTALNQAQANLVQARYNYLVARAQIEALVGHSL